MWRSAAGIGLARVLVASDVLQRGKRGAQTTQAEPARTLSLNRIIWMAGSRAVPQNGRITWNQGPTTSEFGKHRGNKFSEVLADDPDYLAWAKGQEAKLRRLGEQSTVDNDGFSTTARSDSIEHFLEYAASKDDPAKYDLAYKEGLTRALLQQAKADVNTEETESSASSKEQKLLSTQTSMEMNTYPCRPDKLCLFTRTAKTLVGFGAKRWVEVVGFHPLFLNMCQMHLGVTPDHCGEEAQIPFPTG